MKRLQTLMTSKHSYSHSRQKFLQKSGLKSQKKLISNGQITWVSIIMIPMFMEKKFRMKWLLSQSMFILPHKKLSSTLLNTNCGKKGQDSWLKLQLQTRPDLRRREEERSQSWLRSEQLSQETWRAHQMHATTCSWLFRSLWVEIAREINAHHKISSGAFPNTNRKSKTSWNKHKPEKKEESKKKDITIKSRSRSC